MVQPGIYKHYKGNLYQVIGVAKEADEDELKVVYTPLYPCQYQLLIKALKSFNESVEVDGKIIHKYEKVG